MTKLPGGKPIGTTNFICVGLIAYKPHAAPAIETDTPFSSIGKLGARFDSEALAGLTVMVFGAKLTLDCATLSSPAAKPVGLGVGVGLGLSVGLGVGLGLGLGLGVGVGLTVGLGVGVGLVTGTLIKVAPVKSEMPPSD